MYIYLPMKKRVRVRYNVNSHTFESFTCSSNSNNGLSEVKRNCWVLISPSAEQVAQVQQMVSKRNEVSDMDELRTLLRALAAKGTTTPISGSVCGHTKTLEFTYGDTQRIFTIS